MNEISKLNIKDFQLQNNIYLIFITSTGYIICIQGFCSKDYRTIDDCIILYKITDNNIIFIQKIDLFGYSPILLYELKNKSVLFTGRNHLALYKIKDDKIYMSSYHGDYKLGEIYQLKELENENIIFVNYKGDIYVAKKINNQLVGYYEGGIPIYNEIEIQDSILNEEIYPILFSQGNIVFFNCFKIDFSLEKYQKSNLKKIYEYNLGREAYFGVIYESDKLVFALNSIIEKKYFKNNINCPYNRTLGYELLIINKEYLEVIEKIELETRIGNLINIDNNIFLYSMKDKYFIREFSDSGFNIIESKNIENFSSTDIFFIKKYHNKIFFLYINEK